MTLKFVKGGKYITRGQPGGKGYPVVCTRSFPEAIALGKEQEVYPLRFEHATFGEYATTIDGKYWSDDIRMLAKAKPNHHFDVIAEAEKIPVNEDSRSGVNITWRQEEKYVDRQGTVYIYKGQFGDTSNCTALNHLFVRLDDNGKLREPQLCDCNGYAVVQIHHITSGEDIVAKYVPKSRFWSCVVKSTETGKAIYQTWTAQEPQSAYLSRDHVDDAINKMTAHMRVSDWVEIKYEL